MRSVIIAVILWAATTLAWADLIMSALPDIVVVLHEGKPVGEGWLIRGVFQVCPLDLVPRRSALARAREQRRRPAPSG